MTTNLPLVSLTESSRDSSRDGELAADALANAAKLERCRQRHEREGKPGFWTGTREGMIATVIAVVTSLLFGGAAGVWFDQAGWMVRSLAVGGGTMLMAVIVCLSGSLLAGRNAIFWGMGMPLLVYAAGSFAALISGHAGATTLLFGAPLFCGLAIAAGVITAFAIDRGR